MKMETGVFAERDGVVAEVLVTAGTQVDTKQLLMVVDGESSEEPASESSEEG
jgi:pyruvate carboxylase